METHIDFEQKNQFKCNEYTDTNNPHIQSDSNKNKMKNRRKKTTAHIKINKNDIRCGECAMYRVQNNHKFSTVRGRTCKNVLKKYA